MRLAHSLAALHLCPPGGTPDLQALGRSHRPFHWDALRPGLTPGQRLLLLVGFPCYLFRHASGSEAGLQWERGRFWKDRYMPKQVVCSLSWPAL